MIDMRSMVMVRMTIGNSEIESPIRMLALLKTCAMTAMQITMKISTTASRGTNNNRSFSR